MLGRCSAFHQTLLILLAHLDSPKFTVLHVYVRVLGTEPRTSHLLGRAFLLSSIPSESSLIFLFEVLFPFLCFSILFVCMSVSHVCAVSMYIRMQLPAEASRGHRISLELELQVAVNP